MVERNGAGFEQLVVRLRQLAPHIVALEATGGFETLRQRRWRRRPSGRRRQSGAGPRLCQGTRTTRQDRSDRCRCHRPLCRRRHGPNPGRCRTKRHGCLSDLVTRRRQIVDMIGAERQREKRATSRSKKEHHTARQGAGEGAVSVETRHRRCRASFAGLARDRGSARLRSRRRAHHRPHA